MGLGTRQLGRSSWDGSKVFLGATTSLVGKGGAEQAFLNPPVKRHLVQDAVDVVQSREGKRTQSVTDRARERVHVTGGKQRKVKRDREVLDSPG